jgi:hypothetical protein
MRAGFPPCPSQFFREALQFHQSFQPLSAPVQKSP